MGFTAPLMHKLCEIYKLFHECFKFFPKQEKYSLGQKIENTILEILEFSLQAAYLPKGIKNEVVRKASNKTDLLKYLIRLAYETKSLNMRRYVALEKSAVEIGKMLGGWIRSI